MKTTPILFLLLLAFFASSNQQKIPHPDAKPKAIGADRISSANETVIKMDPEIFPPHTAIKSTVSKSGTPETRTMVPGSHQTDSLSALNLGEQLNQMDFSPGRYVFKVWAVDADGLWSETASYTLAIRPPWWSYAGYVLLFALALWSFAHWKNHALLKRSLELEKTVKQNAEELHLAKVTAEMANKAKSSFLATVSHELRAPLTSIIGFTKLNRKYVREHIAMAIDHQNIKAQKYFKKLQKNQEIVALESERILLLINDLLDLAKIESGKVTWKMKKNNPAEIIELAIATTAPLFEQKPNLRLIKEIPEDLPLITADQNRLVQVLINLISNAVKFTDSGHIKIGAGPAPLRANHPISTQEGTNIIFWVEDTGSGIPTEHIDKVFEKFNQVDDNQNGKPKGTGLGLPICKEIVEYHGGRMWVESELRKGSVFAFVVPVGTA